MKILCTQEFPGDVRMLGSVVAGAPTDMEFVLLPPLQALATSLPLIRQFTSGADALLTCHLWAPATWRAMFPTLPLVFMPHNACPVKAHYWFPQVLQVADLLLVTGNSLRKKTQRLNPDARMVDVPYPRLEEYRRVEVESGPPIYDLVFACTAYGHYEALMGIPSRAACWHELVGDLAERGFKLAVLRHQDDQGLVEIPGVDYFDQPNPGILFAGKAVVSDIASNGLLAAALGKPVFQVIDREGAVEPRMASHLGFLDELFELGPRYGRDWTVDNLNGMPPFGTQLGDLCAQYQPRISYHINRQLAPNEFYGRLAEALVAFREPNPIFA